MNKEDKPLSKYTSEELRKHYNGIDLIPVTHFAKIMKLNYKTVIKRYPEALVDRGVKMIRRSLC